MSKIKFQKKLCKLLDDSKLSDRQIMETLGEFFALAVANTALGVNCHMQHSSALKYFKDVSSYIHKMTVELYKSRVIPT